jgi:hypothetical protein
MFAIAIAKTGGHLKDAGHAMSKRLFHMNLGTRSQVERPGAPIGLSPDSGKVIEVRLRPRAHDRQRRIDLKVTSRGEKFSHQRLEDRARFMKKSR